MDFELHRAVTLTRGAFSLLIAPPEMLVEALSTHLELQRYRILYVCGNHSHILGRLDRQFTDLDVRRAFTAFQMMTILGEASHTITIIEHDPTIYEDDGEILAYMAKAMEEAARDAVVLLYAPESDPYLEEISMRANRVFYFNQDERIPRRARKQAPADEGGQTTLGAF